MRWNGWRLREQVLRRLLVGLRIMLDLHADNHDLWVGIKEAYARLINQRRDVELAETFYNSVTRRMLTTVGVDQSLEFVWFGATTIPTGNTPVLRVYSQVSTLDAMIEAILRDYAFAVPYHDLEGDAEPRGARSWKVTCAASGTRPTSTRWRCSNRSSIATRAPIWSVASASATG